MKAFSSGFEAADLKRLSTCLDRLMPHVDRSDVAITGGVAIQLRVAEIGAVGTRHGLADLDLVASSIEAVSPSVCETFLVSHYHVVRPGVPKFMLQLVDPVSTIRVDVFPDLVCSVERATVLSIDTHHARVLALEDVLEHKLLTISKASRSAPVDPKHASDAQALGRLLGRAVASVGPDCLRKDVYGTDAEHCCARCQSSLDARFPLAPKSEIFRLLGWT